jgi:hypothetical protein
LKDMLLGSIEGFPGAFDVVSHRLDLDWGGD